MLILLLVTLAYGTRLSHLKEYSVSYASHLTHAKALGGTDDDSQEWLVTALDDVHLHLDMVRNRDLFPKGYTRYRLTEQGVEEHQESPRRHCHFHGTVRGDPESRVALSTCGGVLHGEIVTSSHSLFIEPHTAHFDEGPECAVHGSCGLHMDKLGDLPDYGLHRHWKEAAMLPHIVYSGQDLGNELDEAYCGVEDHVHGDDGQGSIWEHLFDEFHDMEFPHWSVEERKWRLQTLFIEDIKYVEVLGVNDKARYTDKGSAAAAEAHTETLINIVNSRYIAANFYPEIRVVLVSQLTVTSADPWAKVACESDASETDHSELLDNFLEYVSSNAGSFGTFDNAHLFSALDFCDGTVGYAPVGAMCYASRSGGISQITYADQQSATIVSHELGHNFNMLHDGSSNDCDYSSFIMASSSCLACDDYLDTFSTCSQTYFEALMYYRPSTTSCLDNVPDTRYSGDTYCGDGVVEEGEECDCGFSDCSEVDTCCNGATCQLYSGAECSNLDACCDECKIVPASSALVCRGLFDSECDYAEVCDGSSASCPDNVYKAPGSSCTSTEGGDGLCYNGGCLSHDLQCLGVFTSTTGGCSSVSCGGSLTCFVDGVCRSFESSFGDGTPCSCTGGDTAPCQCFDGACESSAVLHYTWETQCSLECGNDDIVQQVACRYYDGEFVDDALCAEAGAKPTSASACSSFAPIICSLNVTTSTGGAVAVGDTLTVQWETVGTVDYLSILLQPSALIWPSYLDVYVLDTGSYQWTVAPGFDAGDYSVVLLVSSSSQAVSNTTFSMLDQCLAVDCGAMGECVRGTCECDPGYTGDLCEQTVCEAAGLTCLNDATCGLSVTPTCECPTQYTGQTCQVKPSCGLSCGSFGEADANCTACTCLGYAELGADGLCGCATACGTKGVMNTECTACVCDAYVTGDACETAFMLVSVEFDGLSVTDLPTFEEIGRFGDLIDAEVVHLIEYPAGSVASDSDTFGLSPVGLVTTVTGTGLDVDELGGVADLLADSVADVNSALYRSYAMRHVASVAFEGNLPVEEESTVLNWLLQWIQDNLTVVAPVAGLLVLLVMYKVRSDKKDKLEKLKMAGVDVRHRPRHQDRRAREAARKREEERLLGQDKKPPGKDKKKDKPKKKEKPKKEKPKKEKPKPKDEDILVSEFGVVRRNGLEDGRPLLALATEDPLAEGLPLNWSVQYFDDGTVFYFNSLTDEWALERP